MEKPIYDIDALKKQYSVLRKKYKLPEFSKLNEEFEIEKTQERETEFLLREIRRTISDKISSFIRFFELFLNPQPFPIFILSMIKNLTAKEKTMIEKIYKELVTVELTSLSLDIYYKEAREVEFIKDIFKKWQELKPELKEISDILTKIQSREVEKKNRSYFG